MSEELKWPEPVAHLIERHAFRCSQHGQDAEGNDWLEVDEEVSPKAFPVYTAAQVTEMLASLRSELEAARGKVEAAKLPEGKWSLGHRDGNWREIDHADHQAVMRIVWRMEDDDGPNHFLESQARAVVAALNDAAAPHHTPPNPPQHSHLSEAQRCTQD